MNTAKEIRAKFHEAAATNRYVYVTFRNEGVARRIIDVKSVRGVVMVRLLQCRTWVPVPFASVDVG